MKNLRCIKCTKDAITVYRGYSLCVTHFNEQVRKDRGNKNDETGFYDNPKFHSIFEMIFGK
jgi:hypothetical protein